MYPIEVRESDIIFVRHNGTTVRDMHCKREGPVIVSCVWKPTDAERDQLAVDGFIKLSIWSTPIPPVLIEVVPNDGETREV